MTNKYLEKIAALNFPIANAIHAVSPVKGIVNSITKGGVKGSVFGRTMKPGSLTKVASPRYVREAMKSSGIFPEFAAIGSIKGNWRKSFPHDVRPAKPNLPFSNNVRLTHSNDLKTAKELVNNRSRWDPTPDQIREGYRYNLSDKLNPHKK